ncbi:MAG TPA: VOC family protein [Ancylobacter sp.]
MSATTMTGAGHAPDSLAPRRVSMGRVVLTVNDLDRMRTFYEQAAGLHLLRQDGTTAELGVGASVLLELRRDALARRRSPREAGLFHTAFLLPSRGDLARWTKTAIGGRTPVVGTSDHSVSEAIYLADPEGNGVEIYADRPVSSWRWKDGAVTMPSNPLDVQDLLAAAGDGNWLGFPEGSAVGHVHLQVGAIAPAEAFYSGVLGLDITCRYPGGTFYAEDGYHHHIATNIWNSRGAASRAYPSTGLAELAIHLDAGRAEAIGRRGGQTPADAHSFTLRDPWNTAIAIVPVADRRPALDPKGP